MDAHTTARLNDCTMHHNGQAGLNAYARAVVELHGTKTDIHSNKMNGVLADLEGTVKIHLPAQHNTSHGNDDHDRLRLSGGTIVNQNADGTFTTQEEEDEDDD
jgi:hypothetical protein